MDEPELAKLLSRFCYITKKPTGEIFWRPWGMYLSPDLFTQLIEFFIKNHGDKIEKADVICAIPQSGLPIAICTHLAFKKPLIIIDFSSDDLYVLPENPRTPGTPLNVLVIDAAVNSGGTILHANSILHAKMLVDITYLTIVFNDLMPNQNILPFREKLVQNQQLDWLFKLSELHKATEPWK
jgi:hypothetical protein